METFIIPIIFSIISIIFTIIGIIFYKSFKTTSEDLKSSIIVKAQVIRNEKKTSRDGDTYVPVYRYIYDRFEREYISNVSYGTPKEIGTIEEINVLSNGKIITNDSVFIEKTIGITFIAIGIFTAVISITTTILFIFII